MFFLAIFYVQACLFGYFLCVILTLWGYFSCTIICVCRLFAWQPDRVRGERERHERVMVLKNAFDPGEFDQSPQLMLEYRQDVSDECAKYGLVKKVVVHDVSAAVKLMVVAQENVHVIYLLSRR